MEKFITECPIKTKAMKVHVTNKNNFHYFYDVPAGFQLEKYISSLYPNSSLILTFPKNENNNTKRDFKVEVHDEFGIIETHWGIYIEDKNGDECNNDNENKIEK